MRTLADRVRHAILFEILGLVIVTPLGALAFGLPLHQMGVVTLVCALIAMAWVFVFNYLFDVAMQKIRGTTQKNIAIRVGHTILFEVGLVAMLMPYIASYLGVSLWEAFVMDLAFSGFYMVYAFVYNWGYDRVFPVAPRAQPGRPDAAPLSPSRTTSATPAPARR
ncbi:PACE efflux transporter [Acuticoccus sp. I52.16.1]|uniref:PACE efflux transporter n=1 Tax=Acuticoccus sp. I52.16.1 TaxID=2928472 RepID=UPI001FD4970C|nr:PACE efflux transporter [Acuticoccus sp. I52.16.1]UOM35421.1 PACE efflux transporter [Acuticoccus sp. I52.16.1]